MLPDAMVEGVLDEYALQVAPLSVDIEYSPLVIERDAGAMMPVMVMGLDSTRVLRATLDILSKVKGSGVVSGVTVTSRVKRLPT